ncbi:coiled-coil domain-containing protein 62 isoform X3 [Amblyraja radiata]|uniref:coiled-coil domain-containing protein 62 isoform X3 n=1 Tax=Amblyraja radiata TaxID=386614 RepID=UPI001403DDC7|nr:coiled-coil domain-containing protein 62 isoform X3 [Amblyraja radiata]
MAPGVEMEGDIPSGDSTLINPRNTVTAAGSASECHIEQWRSTPKSKPSLENVSCSKSIGDSKMNFGKMQDFAPRYKTGPTKAIHAIPTLNGSSKNNANIDLENATIQKQRTELQLLVAELKDRDKELNEMVSAHQKQLLAWEEDRLRILGLEERCAKVEHELRNRNEIIRTLSTQQKILESQQADCLKTLNCTQQKLKEMSEKAAESVNICEELEDRNKSLNSSVMELSAQVGQLQAHEQELATMLELKDKDMVEATNHIMDLTARFKTLEGALREARLNETNSRKEVHDCKQHSKKLRHEICKLKDELDEKTAENNEQREDIIRLKQERQYLGNELTLAVEREKRKDQILELARSKQERADTELHGLRQVNEKQQHDLQLLHLNLESSQELIQKQEEKILEISDERLDLNAYGLESPLRSMTSSPVRERARRKSSLHGELCGSVSPSRLNANEDNASASAPNAYREDCSPTSKLQRLLAESRQMVASLERSTQLPLSLSSCASSNSNLRDGGSL